jgi:hypothetical protein
MWLHCDEASENDCEEGPESYLSSGGFPAPPLIFGIHRPVVTLGDGTAHVHYVVDRNLAMAIFSPVLEQVKLFTPVPEAGELAFLAFLQEHLDDSSVVSG